MTNTAILTETSPQNTSTPKPLFFDAILRDATILDEMVCDPDQLTSTIQKLLAVSIFGLMIFGMIVGIAFQMDTSNNTIMPAENIIPPVLWIPLTLTGGFLTAIAICLPSFYFYTQLAGLDAPFRLITAQSLRVQARASVVLLGITPFYAAWILAPHIGLISNGSIGFQIIGGFFLPYLAGFAGLISIYRSFSRLVHRLPITHPRRGNTVRRMVLCWAAVCMFIAPVAMYRISEFLIHFH